MASIRSLQRGQENLTSGEDIVNRAISSVVLSNTELFGGGDGGDIHGSISISLTSATNVRVERFANTAATIEIPFEVIEWHTR